MVNGTYLYWAGERNRCTIHTPQGEQILLSVPLCKHTDGQISYMHKWQHQHWMALLSAYGKTPYFDFYRPYIEPLYRTHFDTIYQLNAATTYLITCFLTNTMPSSINPTTLSHELSPIHHPNMLDILFEYGPETTKYL